jgi:hypothetical protein
MNALFQDRIDQLFQAVGGAGKFSPRWGAMGDFADQQAMRLSKTLVVF